MADNQQEPDNLMNKDDARAMHRSLKGMTTYLSGFFKEFVTRTNENKSSIEGVRQGIDKVSSGLEKTFSEGNQKNENKINEVNKQLEKTGEEIGSEIEGLAESIERTRKATETQMRKKLESISTPSIGGEETNTPDVKLSDGAESSLVSKINDLGKERDSILSDRIFDKTKIDQKKLQGRLDRNLTGFQKLFSLFSQETEKIAMKETVERKLGFQKVIDEVIYNRLKLNKSDVERFGILDILKTIGMGFASGAFFWGALASQGIFIQHFKWLTIGFQKSWEVASGFFKSVKNGKFFTDMMKFLKGIPFVEDILTLPQKTIGLFKEVFGMATKGFTKIKNVVTAIMSPIDTLTGIFSPAGSIAKFFNFIQKFKFFSIGLKFANKLAWFIAPAIAIFDGFKSIFDNWEEMGPMAILKGISDGVYSLLDQLILGLPEAIGDLIGMMFGENNFVTRFLKDVSGFMRKSVGGLFDDLFKGFERSLGGLKKIFEGDVLAGLKDLFMGSPPVVYIKNMVGDVQDLFTWINKTFGWAWGWAKDDAEEEEKKKKDAEALKKIVDASTKLNVAQDAMSSEMLNRQKTEDEKKKELDSAIILQKDAKDQTDRLSQELEELEKKKNNIQTTRKDGRGRMVVDRAKEEQKAAVEKEIEEKKKQLEQVKEAEKKIAMSVEALSASVDLASLSDDDLKTKEGALNVELSDLTSKIGDQQYFLDGADNDLARKRIEGNMRELQEQHLKKLEELTVIENERKKREETKKETVPVPDGSDLSKIGMAQTVNAVTEPRDEFKEKFLSEVGKERAKLLKKTKDYWNGIGAKRDEKKKEEEEKLKKEEEERLARQEQELLNKKNTLFSLFDNAVAQTMDNPQLNEMYTRLSAVKDKMNIDSITTGGDGTFTTQEILNNVKLEMIGIKNDNSENFELFMKDLQIRKEEQRREEFEEKRRNFGVSLQKEQPKASPDSEKMVGKFADQFSKKYVDQWKYMESKETAVANRDRK
jgi:hypothetical protein